MAFKYAIKISYMKKSILTFHRVFIKNFRKENQDFLQLFGIYKETIDPTLDYETFLQLYYSKTLVAIDFTLFSSGNKRVGFSAAFFYSAIVNGKPSFIARSATGLNEDFQGQGLHNKFDLYFKFIRFALSHPRKPLWVTVFVVNPFVFSELCRLVPVFFPMIERHTPETIQKIMDEIIDGNGHPRDDKCPYSVKVPIQVKFNEKLLKRIFSSDDPNIEWYLKQNPGFLDKYGLLVVISVSFKNIGGTLCNFIMLNCSKKLNRLYKRFKSNGNVTKPETIIVVETIVKKWIL
jgi:hypothetical protein